MTPHDPARALFFSFLLVLAAMAVSRTAQAETFIVWIETQPLERYVVFTIFGLFGMFSHFLKMWATREIESCLWDYWWRQSPRSTVLAIMGFVSASGAMMLAGDFPATPWSTLISLAVTTGYTCDSALNKKAVA